MFNGAESEVITIIVVIEDTEAKPSEFIFWKLYCIDYLFLVLVQNELKPVRTVSLGEIADGDTVPGVEFE